MSRIQLRQTHPNLFRGSLAVALVFFALGMNIVVFKPTFDQYGLVRWVSGLFALFASVQLYALWAKRLPTLRVSQAAIFFVALFWAGALTIFTFQTHKTSLALPICFYGLAVWQLLQLIEPASNPANEKKSK